MRKIILNLAVTLDGFIEGPNGEIDWINVESDQGTYDFFDRFLPEIDTIFYGRVTYDLWGQYQPGENASADEKKLWNSVHGRNKYVFSKNPPQDDRATYISTDIENSVREIKNQPGKNIWLYGGAKLVTSFINAGLVDTYLLAVFPVILGDGKPLFSHIKRRVGLSLRQVEHTASGILLVTYDAT